MLKKIGISTKNIRSNRIEINRRVEQNLVIKFQQDLDNPYLVSFPRTGSHWLRMLIELYFERPTLVRAFYFMDRDDFILYHTHDMELSIRRDNVIYLYREPINTIFSQMNYEKENISDLERIKFWVDCYGKHLTKWLIEEDFTKKKLLIRYEKLKADLPNEFSKIVDFFGGEFESERLKKADELLTKSEVKKKTAHDRQVMQLEDTYEQDRVYFRKVWGGVVKDLFDNKYPDLSRLLFEGGA